MARSIKNVRPGARTAKPMSSAERAIARAAEEYAEAHLALERRYARLVAAIRRHPQIPRRRIGALAGLSKTRVQQIIEEE